MANLVYATSRDLEAIAPTYLAAAWGSDPWFESHIGYEFRDVATVVWEQKDYWTGFMKPRVLDGGFNKVDREGRSQYRVQPGYFGDQKTMWEEFLTTAREIGTYGKPLDMESEQQNDLNHLLNRGYNLIRYCVWQLLTTGSYTLPFGAGFSQMRSVADSFSFQTYAATTSWSNLATSTPIQDLRNMKLKARGFGVRFDSTAELVVNQVTYNYALSNTNPNDLGGRRILTNNSISTLTPDMLNSIMLENDLPRLRVYDEGYYPDPIGGVPQAWTPFIPTGTGVLWGSRTDGAKVLDWIFTHNPNNLVPTSDGRQSRTVGRSGAQIYVDFELKKNPIRPITTVGFNGAPAVWFPSAIVIATL